LLIHRRVVLACARQWLLLNEISSSTTPNVLFIVRLFLSFPFLLIAQFSIETTNADNEYTTAVECAKAHEDRDHEASLPVICCEFLNHWHILIYRFHNLAFY
jgi:hypothetical protein